MDGFNQDAVIKTLESYRIKPRGAAALGPPGPLVRHISLHAEAHAAKEGTPELYFTDPDGLWIQIQLARDHVRCRTHTACAALWEP